MRECQSWFHEWLLFEFWKGSKANEVGVLVQYGGLTVLEAYSSESSSSSFVSLRGQGFSRSWGLQSRWTEAPGRPLCDPDF